MILIEKIYLKGIDWKKYIWKQTSDPKLSQAALTTTALKAMGIDLSSAGLDLNTLASLAEMAQKYDKNNQAMAAAAAAAGVYWDFYFLSFVFFFSVLYIIKHN